MTLLADEDVTPLMAVTRLQRNNHKCDFRIECPMPSLLAYDVRSLHPATKHMRCAELFYGTALRPADATPG